MCLGAIGGRSRRPTANPDLIASAFVQKQANQRRRVDFEVDAIGIHLSSSEDRSHQIMQPFRRHTFPSSGEGGHRVSQSFLHQSVAFIAR
jgi:hypothetical protein